jgi:hypothetical protein
MAGGLLFINNYSIFHTHTQRMLPGNNALLLPPPLLPLTPPPFPPLSFAPHLSSISPPELSFSPSSLSRNILELLILKLLL